MKHIRFSLLAAAGAVLFFSMPTMAAQTVRDGIEAWQRGDYASAVTIWRPLASKGDADAAFNLGQAYRLGRGVPVDLATAQGWLEQAALKGHLDAQTTLGLLLFDNGNRQGAMRWLKQAAQRGEPRAMLVYGTALYNGDGVPRDPALAYAYVRRSAAQGLQPAKSTLEQMDAILPADIREKGVQLATTLPKSVAPARISAAKAAPKAPPPAETKVASTPAKPTEAKARTASNAPAQEVAIKKAAPAASGSWRVQLGAFSKRASAESLYNKLSGAAPVAGHRAVYEAAGGVTRLQVAGFPSRSAAESACSALSKKGQACFPVEGK